MMSNLTVFPDAQERCDGLDNNCDGSVALIENDNDGDLYVVCDIDIGGWDAGNGIVGGLDCDDENSTVFPDAQERCDGLDNDCDALLPEDEQDLDQDGFVECSIDSGGWQGIDSSILGDDCDDGNAFLNPDTEWFLDDDGDSFGGEFSQVSCSPLSDHVLDLGDCNDSDAAVFSERRRDPR